MMKSPLLQHKFHPPARSTGDLVRSRLMQEIDQGMSGRLVLISAPAGSGKTTLLSHWAAQPQRKSAWLTLDNTANDPGKFLKELLQSLQHLKADVNVGVLEKLRGENPSAEATLQQIADNLGMLMFDCAIILDDVHLIQAPPVHNMIQYLLDHLPSQIHLVLSSRNDPPLNLAPLRAQGQLTELHAPQLGFMLDEATALLKDVMGLKLTSGEVTGVLQKAKSRAVDLQLAGLCMQLSEHPGKFLTQFEQDQQEERSYLLTFLLNNLSETEQYFLRRCALLPLQHPDLCLAICSDPPGDELLLDLSRRGIGFRLLSEKNRVYEIQPLIREWLAIIESTDQRTAASDVHQQAALWFAQYGEAGLAFHHAIQAADYSFAGEIVAQNAMEMLQAGELYSVSAWLAQLPAEVTENTPMLCICQAWIHLIKREFDAIEPHLANALQASARAIRPEEIASHVQAIRDYLVEVSRQ